MDDTMRDEIERRAMPVARMAAEALLNAHDHGDNDPDGYLWQDRHDTLRQALDRFLLGTDTESHALITRSITDVRPGYEIF